MDIIVVWALLIGLVLVAGVSKRIRSTAVTLPMLYVLFGLAVGVLFSDYIGLTFDDPIVEVIATLALALVLATDASRIKLKRPVSNYTLPLRLLGIGLPLTIALGAVVAAVEAMKAKHDIKSPVAGKVTAIHVKIGDEIDSSNPIMTIA